MTWVYLLLRTTVYFQSRFRCTVRYFDGVYTVRIDSKQIQIAVMCFYSQCRVQKTFCLSLKLEVVLILLHQSGICPRVELTLADFDTNQNSAALILEIFALKAWESFLKRKRLINQK